MAHIFNLGNEQLVISDELSNYNELRQEFIPLANKVEEKFKQIYLMENHDMESMINNFPDQVVSCLNIVIDYCISKMIENGIYDIDREIFVSQYCTKYVTVVERFDEYLAKFSEINGDLEAAKEYREYRKATRGMFVGGGFGVKGAMKGMATAGALNISTGLLHSIANGIGNMYDKAVANHKMETIFNDPLTLYDLASSVWESAFNIHYAYIDVLENRSGIAIPKFSMENIRKSQAIYQNIVRLELPFEQAQKPLCEMFALQPYEYEYYQYVIMQYGDKDNQLQKIGEFFHINMLEMKMVLLQTLMSSALNYNTIEEDIDVVIQRVKNIADFFGIPKVETDKIRERVRSSFIAYKFSNGIESKTGLFLSDKMNRNDLLTEYYQYKKKIRQLVAEVFTSTLQNKITNTGLIGPDDIDKMSSEYEDYLLLFSVNSEKNDFLFKVSDSLFEYGRGRVCRISCVNEISVQDKKLVINKEIWIPLTCENLDEKLLEDILRKVVKIIQTADKSKITDMLTISYNEASEAEQNIVKDINIYVSSVSKDMKRFSSVYNLFCPEDLEHLIVYHNICSKMYLQTKKNFVETPVIFFKTRVTTSMNDENYADTEYNKTLYKVTSDEYALFTNCNIVFTSTGRKVPISNINKVLIDDEDGSVYILDGKTKCVITNCFPEASAKLKDLIEKIIQIYQGKKVKVKAASGEPVDAYMAEIYTKVLDYAKKRMSQEVREKIFSRILINCNNDDFDKAMECFVSQYSYLRNKEILFMIRDSADNPSFACFVTKEEICHIYKAKNGNMYCGFDTPDSSLLLKQVKCFREYCEKVEGARDNIKFCLSYYCAEEQDEEYFTSVFECDNDIRNLVHNVVTIANMLLDYVCQKEKICRKNKQESDSSGNVLEEISALFNSMHILSVQEKSIYLFNGTNKYGAYEMLTNASKYYDSTDEPVIFMYNDALMKAGAHGIIVTTNKLYYDIVPEKGSISLSDIKEIRYDNGNALIITNYQQHRLQYTNPKEIHLKQLTVFLSELVFLLQEKGEQIVDDVQRIKEKKEAENQKRKQKGVYNYIQRSAVAKLKNYYDSHSELHSGPKFFFNDGTPDFEKKINELKLKYEARIDNIEVPLIAVQTIGHERKEGFILTNEKWHHMVSGFSVSLLGRNFIKRAVSESSLTQESEIIMLQDGNYDNYRVCKVENDKKNAYVTFLDMIIESLDELSGNIDLSQEELKQKQKQLTQLVQGYQQKTSKELQELQATIAVEYPFDFSEPIKKQIEEQLQVIKEKEIISEIEKKCQNLSEKNLNEIDKLKKDLEKYPANLTKTFFEEIEMTRKNLILKLNQELEEMILGYENMNLDELSELIKKVKLYPEECNKDCVERLVARKNEIYEQKWNEKCNDLETRSLTDVDKLIEELQAEKCSNKIKDLFLCKLYSRLDAIYEEQIRELIDGFEKMSIEQLQEILNKLQQYPNNLTTDAEKTIAKQIRKLYKEKIEERSKNLNIMSIEEVLNLQELLKKETCDNDIKYDFECQYNERLRILYIELFEKWASAAENGEYLDAERVRIDIINYNAPDDIKTQYIAKLADIVKNLYNKKNNHLYTFVDNIMMQRNLFDSGLSTRAQSDSVKQILSSSFSQYNYWEDILVSHYVSKILGRAGYAFTPDKFYIFGSSVASYEISSIAGFNIVKKFMNMDIVLTTTTGISTNLGSKHGKNIEIVADTLNQILNQLRSTNFGMSNQQQEKFCSNCGERIYDGAKFCKKCGTSIL